jgi:hypothetical protein
MIALQDPPADRPRGLTEDELDALLLVHSRPFARAALIDFRAAKAKALGGVQRDQLTKRETLEVLRRRYNKLLAEYLRIHETTYAGWLEHGPTQEWEEVLAAAKDDAVWDRLVERGLAELCP